MSPSDSDIKITKDSGAASVIENTAVVFTCSVDRIYPKATDFYWAVNGRIPLFTPDSHSYNSDGTFKQSMSLNHKFGKVDGKSQTVKCILVPKYGNKISHTRSDGKIPYPGSPFNETDNTLIN